MSARVVLDEDLDAQEALPAGPSPRTERLLRIIPPESAADDLANIEQAAGALVYTVPPALVPAMASIRDRAHRAREKLGYAR